jgi:hypothetical protein
VFDEAAIRSEPALYQGSLEEEHNMFGIGKKIQDAIKKAETDPVGAMEDHRKSLNSGLTGAVSKLKCNSGLMNGS